MSKNDPKHLLLSTDIQDPTDFPSSSTTPGLRALDNALRCKICQELYEAPVLLTCGHCFCSLVRVTIAASTLLTIGPLNSVHATNSVRSQHVPRVGKKPPSVASGSTQQWKRQSQHGKTQGTSLVSHGGHPCRLMRTIIRRPFVLEMINETLALRSRATESPRPAKRHKLNTPVLLDLASPQKQLRRPEVPGTSRKRDRSHTGSPDDDVERGTCSNTQPLASKVACLYI